MWLVDKSGTVLEDIGMIKDKSQLPPYNVGNSVSVSGGSLFDTVIALRDAMYRGDRVSPMPAATRTASRTHWAFL